MLNIKVLRDNGRDKDISINNYIKAVNSAKHTVKIQTSSRQRGHRTWENRRAKGNWDAQRGLQGDLTLGVSPYLG